VGRANAFFAQNNPGTQTRGRWSNWTLEQPGNFLQVNGRNFHVTDCDLWSTYNVITSMASNAKTACNAKSWPNACHGASYGRIAGNLLYNGGASHFMNQWRQASGAVCERGSALSTSPRSPCSLT
jgi:hypothetical protein